MTGCLNLEVCTDSKKISFRETRKATNQVRSGEEKITSFHPLEVRVPREYSISSEGRELRLVQLQKL